MSKEAIEMKCPCGTQVTVPYESTVDSDNGKGDYFEGACPECGMILTAGVYDAP